MRQMLSLRRSWSKTRAENGGILAISMFLTAFVNPAKNKVVVTQEAETETCTKNKIEPHHKHFA